MNTKYSGSTNFVPYWYINGALGSCTPYYVVCDYALQIWYRANLSAKVTGQPAYRA